MVTGIGGGLGRETALETAAGGLQGSRLWAFAARFPFTAGEGEGAGSGGAFGHVHRGGLELFAGDFALAREAAHAVRAREGEGPSAVGRGVDDE